MNVKENSGFNQLSKESQRQIKEVAKDSNDKVVEQAIEYRLLGGDY